MIFIGLFFFYFQLTIKLSCSEYGFECDFTLEGKKSLTLIEKLREHFDEEHGIEYSTDAVIQMIVNKGHSKESISKDQNFIKTYLTINREKTPYGSRQ